MAAASAPFRCLRRCVQSMQVPANCRRERRICRRFRPNEQLGQVKAGGRGAHPGQPGQFPGRQRAVRQQRPQDRGPGRVGDQRRGRCDVGVERKWFGRYGHLSTLAQVFFDQHRKMTGDPSLRERQDRLQF
jgi:hypothetical protein